MIEVVPAILAPTQEVFLHDLARVRGGGDHRRRGRQDGTRPQVQRDRHRVRGRQPAARAAVPVHLARDALGRARSERGSRSDRDRFPGTDAGSRRYAC